ncbi:MAG: signal peptidase I [Anaerovoracaceae bacterium]|jgi:signal peptidase I
MDENFNNDKVNHEETSAVETAETAGGKPSKNKNTRREVFTWVRDIAIAVAIALVISYFITPTIVQEHSMEDTLHNNDYLILNKAAYKFGGEPQYGDIVVFKSNIVNEQNGEDKLLIKRVIAKGGDTVSISNGVVYRNGEALDEPYTKDGYTNGGMDETVVPEGTLFLCGDNRLVSLDSRSSEVGFVDESTVIGKAVFRLFPFSDFGGIYDNLPDSD